MRKRPEARIGYISFLVAWVLFVVGLEDGGREEIATEMEDGELAFLGDGAGGKEGGYHLCSLPSGNKQRTDSIRFGARRRRRRRRCRERLSPVDKKKEKDG